MLSSLETEIQAISFHHIRRVLQDSTSAPSRLSRVPNMLVSSLVFTAK